jgi:hypothetical protein
VYAGAGFMGLHGGSATEAVLASAIPREYRVLNLTPLSIVGAHSRIGADHVMLISQMFRRYEAAWGVVFANTYYQFGLLQPFRLGFSQQASFVGIPRDASNLADR